MSKEIAVPVIVDTNILVPSLFSRTPIFKFILSGNLVLIWNKFIRQESCDIINKLWFKHYSKKMPPEQLTDVNELLHIITELGHQVADMPKSWPNISLDRNDDPFLWAALIGKAGFIISADRKHLLSLKIFKGIPIGKPKDFFAWVKIKHPM